MQGTQYNTLNLDVVDEPKVEKGSRKFAILAAVVAASCAMFFAGRVNAQPVGYTHEEVVNVGAYCQQGEFIGDCQKCKECQAFEYSNGGCSFFKDTFCSYCEPIANCKRENTECSTRLNQKCNECECDKEITAWNQVVKEEARAGDETYSCYFGEQCKPCKVCPKGEYQITACDGVAQDTECKPCKSCGDDMYVSKPCSYDSDTECEACTSCDAKGMQTTMESQCTGRLGENDMFVAGKQTECMDCKTCSAFSFVEGVCENEKNTECTTCSDCEEGEYILNECNKDTPVTATGADTVCQKCSLLKDPLESGAFLKTLCEPLGDSDFEYSICTKCKHGEYETKDCFFGDEKTVGDDRTCANCNGIAKCDKNNFCTTDSDETCSRCDQPGAEVIDGRDKAFFNTWGTCCSDRSLGLQCEWTYHAAGCDEGQQNYMERTAKRGGFDGTTSAEFVLWCKLLCEESEPCTAFEVPTAIANQEEEPTAGTICGLKNHKDYDFGSGSAAHTCWSRV